MILYTKLAYVNDDEIMFNWNVLTQDYRKYSIKQFIIDYSIPVELSEAIRLKVHNNKKLRYIRVGNLSFYNSILLIDSSSIQGILLKLY